MKLWCISTHPVNYELIIWSGFYEISFESEM